MNKQAAGSRFRARVRIVGWIILTTALALLAVTLTMRSFLLRQVDLRANQTIVHELDELRAFAREGTDPKTGARFSDVSTLIHRFMSLQTLHSGEVIIGVSGGRTTRVAVSQAGRELAQNAAQVREMLEQPRPSGLMTTGAGEIHWGRQEVEIQTAQGSQKGTVIVAVFTSEARAEAQQESSVLFAVALGGLLLTAGIAWVAASRILSPIRGMERAARTVSPHNLSHRLPVTGRDDIAGLAATVNAMLDRIQQAYVRQQQTLSTVRRDLDQAGTQIEDLLRQGDRPALRAVMTRIRSTLCDLDLLERLDRPDLVSPQPVAVADLTRSLAAAHPGATVTEVAEVTARVDADLLGEAISRLVAQAAARSGPAGTVGIGSAVGDSGVEIWVSDTGAQVDSEQAEALLNGAGLAMSVVRMVADAHYGSVWIESTPDRTRIGVDLPLASAGPEGAA